MRYFTLITVLAALAISCTTTPELEQEWATERVLKTPESVNYDTMRDVLYVSNINGQPTEKDGNGFISTLKLDGTITALKWVEGLDAPKGAAIYDEKLYVTDIDQLVEISIPDANIIARYPAEEAQFLNDVAVDANGTVYVTDYAQEHSAIYRLKDGEFSLWLQDDAISQPNGLLMQDNMLLFGNTGDGWIKSVDINDGTITNVVNVGDGIDGLRAWRDGFVTSNWQGRTVFTDKDGVVHELLDTGDQDINAADLELIASKNLLFIPTFFDNRVVAYTLK